MGDTNGNPQLVAWQGTTVSLYDINGHNAVTINLDALYSETPDIECNKVIGIVSNKYVIFDATDYSKEEVVQIRTVFDVIAESFSVVNSSLLKFGDSII